MLNVLDRMMRILCLPGKWSGWLVLPLAAFIALAILAGKMGRPVLIDFGREVPFLGKALTVNSLVDFQWHFFAVMVLLSGAYALYENRHVSVDTFSRLLSPRHQMMLRLVLDVLFLMPFCAIMVFYGTKFAMVAYTTGEASTQGGLNMRWMIKALIPISFMLLGMMGVLRIVDAVVRLFFTPNEAAKK